MRACSVWIGLLMECSINRIGELCQLMVVFVALVYSWVVFGLEDRFHATWPHVAHGTIHFLFWFPEFQGWRFLAHCNRIVVDVLRRLLSRHILSL